MIASRNLALVLGGMGRRDEALAAARQALALAPDSERPEIESLIAILQQANQ